MSTLRHTTSLCWMSTTYCLHRLHPWYCLLQSPNLYARCKHWPSLGWRSLPTATVCGLSNSSAVESNAFTHHFILLVRGLHPYIESDTSPSSVPVGPSSSSQELLLQGDQPVPQPPYFFQSTKQSPSSVPQPPIQPPPSSSWVDVAAAEQSDHSTPEILVPTAPTLAEYVDNAHNYNRCCIYHQ